MYTHKPQIIKKADITPIEVSIVCRILMLG